GRAAAQDGGDNPVRLRHGSGEPGLVEQAREIGRGFGADLLQRDTANFCELLRRVNDEARLIRLTTMRDRREIGGVGLDQVAVGRHKGGDLLDLLGIAERDNAGKGNVAAKGKRPSSKVRATGAAVEQEGETPLPRLFLENSRHVYVGLAAVDNQWKTSDPGSRDVPAEP